MGDYVESGYVEAGYFDPSDPIAPPEIVAPGGAPARFVPFVPVDTRRKRKRRQDDLLFIKP